MKYFLIFLILMAALCYMLHGLFVMTDGDDDA